MVARFASLKLKLLHLIIDLEQMKTIFTQIRETVLIVPQSYQQQLPNAWAQ